MAKFIWMEKKRKDKEKTLPDFQKKGGAALCGDINRGDKDNCS